MYRSSIKEYEMRNSYVAAVVATLRLGLGGCIEKAHEMLRDLGAVSHPHEIYVNIVGINGEHMGNM